MCETNLVRWQEDELLLSSVDMEKVKALLSDIHKDSVHKTKIFEEYRSNFHKTNQEIQLKKQALEAFQEAIHMFMDQIKLHEAFQAKAQPHEIKM